MTVRHQCTMTLLTDIHPLNVEKKDEDDNNDDDDNNNIYDIKR